VVAPLAVLIIVLGVQPQLLLDIIEPAVVATLDDLGATR
jgi:NADH-quinone oxidoreductase subunit M